MEELELLIRARDQASAQLANVDRRVTGLERSVQGLGRSSQGLGNVSRQLLGIATTAAGIAAGAVSINRFVDAAANTEDALIGVVRTTDLSGEALEQFEARIQSITETIPRGTAELLGIAQVAGQLGVNGSENLARFSETLARLEDATDIVGEQGALQLAQLINVTQGDFANIDRLGASIASLGNNSATTESQIVRAGSQIAIATAAFGISAQDALGLGAAVASLGQQPQLASSAIGRTIRSIQEAIAEGGDGVERFAATAGQSVEEFTDTFNENALEGFVQFLEGLGELDAQDTVIQMRELGLQGDELNRVIPLLASNTDEVRASLLNSNDAFIENTALIDESNRRYQSFRSQVASLGVVLDQLAGTAGGQFIDTLADGARRLAETLRTDEVQLGFIRIGEAIDGVIMAVGGLNGSTLSSFLLAIGTAVDTAGMLVGAVTMIAGTLSGFTISGFNSLANIFRDSASEAGGLTDEIGNAGVEIGLLEAAALGLQLTLTATANAGAQVGARLAQGALLLNRARISNGIRRDSATIERLEGDDDLSAREERRLAAALESRADLIQQLNQVDAALDAAQEDISDRNQRAGEAIDTVFRDASGLTAADRRRAAAEARADAAIEAARQERLRLNNEPEPDPNAPAPDPVEPTGTPGVSESARAAIAAQQEAADALARAEVEIAARISEIEREFAQGNLSIREFYEERQRLQQEGIDAEIASVEAQAAVGDESARLQAQGELIRLQGERRTVAVETINAIADAEERLATDLQAVARELEGLSGTPLTLDDEVERFAEQYAQILQRVTANSDEQGVMLVNNLINTRAAEARLDTLAELVRERSEQLDEDLAANNQTSVGFENVDNGNNLRDEALEDIRRLREEGEQLADTLGSPAALEALDEINERTEAVAQGYRNIAAEQLLVFGTEAAEGISTAIVGTLDSIVTGTQTASEAFRGLGTAITESLRDAALSAVSQIQRVLVEILILQAAQAALSLIPGAGTAFSAALGASGFGQFGGGGGAGGGGGLGGLLGGLFAEGGPVRGPGTATSDSILARLSNGEFVIRTAAVQHYGVELFEALNRMMLNPSALSPIPNIQVVAPAVPQFRDGGLVQQAPGATNNISVVNLIDMDDVLGSYLESRRGERIILNHINRNN